MPLDKGRISGVFIIRKIGMPTIEIVRHEFLLGRISRRIFASHFRVDQAKIRHKILSLKNYLTFSKFA
jgi:hypothetical protein